ncbi:MAG: hypothetical protein ACFCUU_10980 [Cyclobacteriaceae bacterium]
MRKENIVRLIALLHLSLMGALMLNSTLFWHVHQLNDNSLIVHAHPYQKSEDQPFQEHQHTDDELLTIDLISNAVYFSPEVHQIQELKATYTECIECFYNSHIYSNHFLSNKRLRGPPVIA